MLEYAIWITQGLLTVAAAGAVYRVYKGPSVLDRVISVDVILVVVGSILLVDMVKRDHQDFILFVVITAVIGYLGAVAVARFVAGGRPDDDPSKEVERQHQEAALRDRSTEPQAPRSSPAPSASEDDSEAAGEEDESTSWFTALARSGFVPGRTRTGARGTDASEDPPADEGEEQR